jgi:hypothetical protein
LARPFPFQQLSGVEVLVPRSSSQVALPASHTAVAGAVVAGLVLARRWKLATLAALAALLLAFSGVYVGYYYPSGAASGLGFGFLASLVLWPVCSWLIRPVTDRLSRGHFAWLVASRSASLRRARRRSPAPAALARRPRGIVALPKPPGPRLPNAKAMDALRVATQAARSTALAGAPPVTSGPRGEGDVPQKSP